MERVLGTKTDNRSWVMERMRTASHPSPPAQQLPQLPNPSKKKNLPDLIGIVAFLCQLSLSVFVTGVNEVEVCKFEGMLIVHVFHTTC
jgi:hypothetical protein